MDKEAVLLKKIEKYLRDDKAFVLFLFLYSTFENKQFSKEEIKKAIFRENVDDLFLKLTAHNLLKVIRSQDSRGRFKKAEYMVNDLSDFIYIPDVQIIND